MNDNPNLIEPGVRYFIGSTLKECKKFKNKYYNNIFNITTLICLTILAIVFFIYRYKGKPSKQELEDKNIKKKEYIISKLHKLANYKQTLSKKTNMITDLPMWS